MLAAAPCRRDKLGDISGELHWVLSQSVRTEPVAMKANGGDVTSMAAATGEDTASQRVVAQDGGRLAGNGTLDALVEAEDTGNGVGGHVTKRL
eukprot:1497898-Lingulodinium_polyedra.AAC.1